MDKTFEVEHRGITLKASPQAIVEALLARFGAQQAPVVSGDIPLVGSLWPEQGGWRAAEIRGENGKPNYDLILVQGDDGKPVVIENVEWGRYGHEITGCASLTDGQANTAAMVEAGLDLAKRITGTKVRGFDDCYLPAICELHAVYMSLREHLPQSYFWSSSQFSAYSARRQGFVSGGSGWGSKDTTYSAFLVRRVLR